MKKAVRTPPYSAPAVVILSALVLALAACPSAGLDPDPTGAEVTVIQTVPSDNAAGVAVNASLSATFSAEMDPQTLNASTFTLMAGLEPISGAVANTGVTATFDPAADLAFGTAYTATITQEARDLEGNAMIEAKVWTFTTGTEPDTTSPSVVSRVPADAAAGASIGAEVGATFSEALDPATVTGTTFTLSDGFGPVSGVVSYAGLSAVFDPEADLAYGTEYTAKITTGIRDLAGNAPVSAESWTFTTEAAPDTLAPTVASTYPAAAASGAATSSVLTATFSEALSPASIVSPASAFSLEETVGAIPVAGIVSLSMDGLTATFTPTAALVAGTEYTARVSTAAEDLAGNHLAVDYAWTFTTAGLRPVMMKSAGDFVILATTGVTVGASATIHGDIGLNTLATSFVGFAQVLDASGTFSKSASALITGKLFASDYSAPTPAYLAAAVEDATAAYADAAGRAGGTDLVSGELGGRALAPGLYYCAAAAAITTNLILDGGPEDIYIFQIGGALSMAAAIQVTLPHGALPKNIFWQTVGAVTLGASAELPGIILSNAAITLGASAVVKGRLFATTIETLAASVSVLEPAP